MVNFVDFLKTWSLRSNSVTRQVNLNKNCWKLTKLKNLMNLHFCTATQQKWLVLLIVTKCVTLVNVVFSTLLSTLEVAQVWKNQAVDNFFLCCVVFFCYSFSPLSKKKVSQVINKLCFKSNNDSLSNTNESSFTFYPNTK